MSKKPKSKKTHRRAAGPSAPGPSQPTPTRRTVFWPALAVTAGLAAAVAWLVWSGNGPFSAHLTLRPSPNVLLVSVDTLRADHLGAYGAKLETPHIDELARSGVVFDKVISSVPVTLPSHTSLFTGRYPIAHGVRDNGSFRLDAEEITLTEIFKDAGYRTAAFIGSFALDSRFGLDQGFDLYDDFYGDTSAFTDFAISERPADDVVRPALEWLKEQSPGRWFVFVHLWDPHYPYRPPSPFRESHPGDPYAGEVAYVDDALGRFLQQLRQLGQLENTLIVFTADHGEGLGDHGEKTHGMFAYEATLHVPLILNWKGVLPEGRRVHPRVRLIDVAPTLLELAGVASRESHQGRSLVPLIRNPRKEEGREMYFEALSFNLNRNWAPLTGVYTGRYKYIDLPIPEIYDIVDDPGETRNLYEQGSELSRRMRAELAGIVDANSTERSRTIQTTQVDRETAARLQALGYLVDPAPSPETRKYTEEDDPKRLIRLSDKFDEGLAAHAAGRPEEAVRIFRELIEERPSFANAYSNLAYVLEDTGRVQEAIAVIESAMENGIQTRPMMGRLGLYYQEIGELDKSVSILESVIEADPTFVEAYNYLSVSYTELGRFEEAIGTIEKLLELDSSYASAYSNLGSVFLAMGRLSEAEANLRRALELDGRLAKAWNGMGVVHARSGRQEEAVSAWKRAVEIDPRQYDTLYNLGTLLTQLNRFREALPYLERFVRTAPPSRYGEDLPKVRHLISELRAVV